jgi:hypothetical protein
MFVYWFNNVHLSRLVFWHQEVASGPFCLLVNSPWLLVFALLIFFIFISALNFYCWKGIHFSFSLDLVLIFIFFGLVITFHFWFRDLLREKLKKYEILLMVLFLGFFSISCFWSSVIYIILLGIFSFIILSNFRCLAWRSFLCSRSYGINIC